TAAFGGPLLDLGCEQNHSRACSIDRLAGCMRRLNGAVKAASCHQLADCSAFAAGKNDAVSIFNLGRKARRKRVGSDFAKSRDMPFEVALQGEYRDSW